VLILLRVMAESDPVKRLKAAARRADGQTSVENQHRWYMEELEQTVGRDPSGTWQERASSSGDRGWLGLVIMVILLATMAFAATLAVLLWRDGAFEGFFASQSISPSHKSQKWVLGDQETGRPSPVPTGKVQKSDAPPNEIEPLIHPNISQPATEEQVESDVVE
jgi:hypothetical protein